MGGYRYLPTIWIEKFYGEFCRTNKIRTVDPDFSGKTEMWGRRMKSIRNE
jgi:hypothetical protein